MKDFKIKISVDLSQSLAGFTEFDKRLNDLNGSLKGLTTNVQSTRNTFSGFGRVFRSTFGQVATALVGVNLLTAGIRKFRDVLVGGITDAIEFERSLVQVSKVADIEFGSDEFVRLADNIQKISIDSGIAATEISGIAAAGARLGIRGSNLDDFTEAIAKSRIALEDYAGSAEGAADKTAVLLNLFQADASETNSLLSVINELSNTAAATSGAIASNATFLAGFATTFGATRQETLALATTMEELGIQTEAFTTAFAKTLIDIQKAPDLFASVFSNEEQALQFETTFETNPIEAFIQLAGELSKEGRDLALVLDDLGLADRRLVREFSKLATDRGITRFTENLRTAREETIRSALGVQSLNDEFERARLSTGVSLDRLRQSVAEFGRDVGEQVLPVLKDAFDQLREFFQSSDADRVAEFLSSIARVSVSGIVALSKAFNLFGVEVIGALAALRLLRRFDLSADLLGGVKTFAALNSNIATTRGSINNLVGGVSNLTRGSSLLRSGLGRLGASLAALAPLAAAAFAAFSVKFLIDSANGVKNFRLEIESVSNSLERLQDRISEAFAIPQRDVDQLTSLVNNLRTDQQELNQVTGVSGAFQNISAIFGSNELTTLGQINQFRDDVEASEEAILDFFDALNIPIDQTKLQEIVGDLTTDLGQENLSKLFEQTLADTDAFVRSFTDSFLQIEGVDLLDAQSFTSAFKEVTDSLNATEAETDTALRRIIASISQNNVGEAYLVAIQQGFNPDQAKEIVESQGKVINDTLIEQGLFNAIQAKDEGEAIGFAIAAGLVSPEAIANLNASGANTINEAIAAAQAAGDTQGIATFGFIGQQLGIELGAAATAEVRKVVSQLFNAFGTDQITPNPDAFPEFSGAIAVLDRVNRKLLEVETSKNRTLGAPSGGGGGGAKTEAEKEAEAVEKAYEELLETIEESAAVRDNLQNSLNAATQENLELLEEEGDLTRTQERLLKRLRDVREDALDPSDASDFNKVIETIAESTEGLQGEFDDLTDSIADSREELEDFGKDLSDQLSDAQREIRNAGAEFRNGLNESASDTLTDSIAELAEVEKELDNILAETAAAGGRDEDEAAEIADLRQQRIELERFINNQLDGNDDFDLNGALDLQNRLNSDNRTERIQAEREEREAELESERDQVLAIQDIRQGLIESLQEDLDNGTTSFDDSVLSSSVNALTQEQQDLAFEIIEDLRSQFNEQARVILQLKAQEQARIELTRVVREQLEVQRQIEIAAQTDRLDEISVLIQRYNDLAAARANAGQGTVSENPVTGSGTVNAASGGLISGPGTATSDSIPAMLSNGEFVQRTAAVQKYGVDFMRRVNNLTLPRFSEGGLAGSSTSTTNNRTANVTINNTGSATINGTDPRWTKYNLRNLNF